MIYEWTVYLAVLSRPPLDLDPVLSELRGCAFHLPPTFYAVPHNSSQTPSSNVLLHEFARLTKKTFSNYGRNLNQF